MNRQTNTLFLISVCVLLWTSNYTCGISISNLSQACLRCICFAAGCHLSPGCTSDRCGPFSITKEFWLDAGQQTLPEDTPDRPGAFEDCARDFFCAARIIQGYLIRFGKDCNDDGVTGCLDYMMIQYNGGQQCTQSLQRNDLGKQWLERFQQCSLFLTE